MPPKPFKNKVVALSGTFPGYKQSELRTTVESLGARFTSTVNDECTHLVTTEKDIDKNSAKYQQACNCPNCHIVSLDWVLDSEKAGKCFPEKTYLLAPSPAGTQTDGNQGTIKTTEKTESKKRSADQERENGDYSTKRQKDAQKASSKTLNVPVDVEFFSESKFSDPSVYIDDTGLIWDATLNQTVASNNNNKFYRIQLLMKEDGTEYETWTRWGRVGELGQLASLGSGTLESAKAQFGKKFKDKSGHKWENRLDPPKPGKYTFIERDYEDDEEVEEPLTEQVDKNKKPKVESALPKSIQDLMSFIFNPDYFLSAMASMSYDAKKLPLGKLSDRTLKTGFSILKELSDLISGRNFAASRPALEALSNRYFTTIPHVFGRDRPPVLSTQDQIKKEVELLEALTDMDVANEIMKDSKDADEIHELDRQFRSLGMQEMTQLNRKSTEYKELESYLTNSRGATHSRRYRVIDIFRIERNGESDRFASSRFANLQNSDRRLLWHGSRSTNFGGILSQGLRIAPPEAPVNGYMFGKGVYLADRSSKSANYCCPYNSADRGLLLLCDAELGDPMLELYDADCMAGENASKENKIATHGKGSAIPGGWKDAACVNPALQGVKMPDVSVPGKTYEKAWLQYNEYIVYDVAQIRLRYLFFVDMR